MFDKFRQTIGTFLDDHEIDLPFERSGGGSIRRFFNPIKERAHVERHELVSKKLRLEKGMDHGSGEDLAAIEQRIDELSEIADRDSDRAYRDRMKAESRRAQPGPEASSYAKFRFEGESQEGGPSAEREI